MKKFVTYISVLLGVLLLFAVAFECTLRLVPNQYKYKYEYMERHADEIETLVMGHSQAADGITPALLGEHVFNLATSSRRLRYDYTLLKQHIDRMGRLKRVIYPYTYNYLYISDEYRLRNINRKRVNAEEAEALQCAYEIYMHTGLYPFPINHIELLYDMTARNKWIKYYLKRQDTQLVDSLGQDVQLREKRRKNWLEVPLAHEYDPANPDYDKAYAQNRAYLYGMAEMCQQHGVQFVLLGFPTQPYYYQSRRPDKLKQYYAEADSLMAKYPNTIFIDHVVDERFTQEDFFDCSHLVKEGADKFTRLLREELLQYPLP